jgi:hypothetical protein
MRLANDGNQGEPVGGRENRHRPECVDCGRSLQAAIFLVDLKTACSVGHGNTPIFAERDFAPRPPRAEPSFHAESPGHVSNVGRVVGATLPSPML